MVFGDDNENLEKEMEEIEQLADQARSDEGAVCDDCGAEFTSQDRLRQHYVQCNYCGERVCRNRYEDHREYHMREKDGPIQRPEGEEMGDAVEAKSVREEQDETRRQAARTELKYRDTEEESARMRQRARSGAQSAGSLIKSALQIIALIMIPVFLFLYVKQALPIVMITGGIASILVAEKNLVDPDSSPIFHGFLSLLFGTLWGLTASNAVLSFLSGDFMHLDFVVNLVTAGLTTYYMVMSKGYADIGESIKLFEELMFGGASQDHDLRRVYALMVLAFLALLFNIGTYFFFGGAFASAATGEGLLVLPMFFLSLTGPIYLYSHIKHQDQRMRAYRQAGQQVSQEASRRKQQASERYQRGKERASDLKQRASERWGRSGEEEEEGGEEE